MICRILIVIACNVHKFVSGNILFTQYVLSHQYCIPLLFLHIGLKRYKLYAVAVIDDDDHGVFAIGAIVDKVCCCYCCCYKVKP
jgi:hypothetical protein